MSVTVRQQAACYVCEASLVRRARARLSCLSLSAASAGASVGQADSTLGEAARTSSVLSSPRVLTLQFEVDGVGGGGQQDSP